MKLTDRQYEEILYQLVKDAKPAEVSKLVKVFATRLAADHRLSHGERIAEGFMHLAKEKTGIVELLVRSAFPLQEVQKKKIAQVFAPQKIEITERIDKNIIGGLVLETKNQILDGSLRQRLKALECALVQG